MKFIIKQFATLRRRFGGDEGGLAAVEFALLTPLLAFGFLAMVDVALAINSRMEMDSALRAAAESALADPGEETVSKVFDASKPVYEEVQSGGGQGGTSTEFAIQVNRYCSCPSSSTQASCHSPCSDEQIPYLFYDLTGTSIYSGIFLEDLQLQRTIKVQLR